MTKEERKHYDKVASIGCIACRMDGYRDSPAELHHIRETAGMGQKAKSDEVIPLCPAHHRGIRHPLISSIHLDRRAFIHQYGTEHELLEKTLALIE